MLYNEKISYEIKVINNSYQEEISVNNIYYNLNTNHRIFIKVNSPSGFHTEKIVKKLLSFGVFETSNYIDFKLYRVNVNFNLSNQLLYESLNSPTNLIDRKLIEGEQYTQTDKLVNLEFDLTDITSDSYVLGIKVSTSVNYNFYKLLNITYTNIWLSGLNNICTYHSTNLTQYDTTYVELQGGYLINEFSLMNTVDDFLPFELNLIHSYDNISYDFSNKFCLNVYYYLYETNGNICLKDNSGNESYYSHISLNLADYGSMTEMIEAYKKLYLELGIKRPNNITNYDFYYCLDTGSYFFSYSTNTDFIILDHNKKSVELKYLSSTSDYKIYGLSQIKDEFNNEINFYYTNNKISSVVTEENTINFTYSNNQIVSIYSTDLNKQVDFEYSTTSVLIKYYFNNVLNDALEIVFNSSSNITRINNKNISNLTGNISYITFTRTSGKLTSIYKYYGSNLTDKMLFSYLTDYTRTTDFRSQYKYYFFDSYGRLSSVVDNNGLCTNNNYQMINSNKELNFKSNSKLRLIRNLLENNSFEYSNGTNLFGWNINSDFSLVDDSLFGGKSLYIDSTNSVNLNQTISVSAGSYRFSIYLKAPLVGTINIYVTLTYTYNDEQRSVSYPVSITGLNNTWKKFMTSSYISVNSSYINPKIKVSIAMSGSNKIYIDEASFEDITSGKYNLIENGYLETVNLSNLPKGFAVTGTNIAYGTDTYSSILNKILKNKTIYFEPIIPAVTNGKISERSIKKTITYSGLKYEKYVYFIMLKTNMNYGEKLVPYVKFYYDNIEAKTYEIKTNDVNDNWQVLSIGIITEDSFSSIEIGLIYNGIKELYVDGFSLEKDGYFNNYNYDSNNSVINLDNNDHSLYDDNKIHYQLNEYGNLTKYEYENDLLKKVIDVYGNQTEYFYNTDKKVIKIKLTTINNEVIEKNYEYTNPTYENRPAYKTKVTNAYGNINSIYKDYLKREYKKELANGEEDYINYNDRCEISKVSAYTDNLEKLANTISNETVNRRINVVNTKGGTAYDYDYDSSNRRTYLTVNGSRLDTLSYHTYNNVYSNLISSKQYGNSGPTYSYVYNSHNLLTEEKLNNTTIKKFEYDIDDNLILSTDSVNGKTTRYAYNKHNLLTKKVLNNLETNYKYDESNNLKEEKIDKNGSYVLNYNHYDYEEKRKNIVSYINKLVRNHNDEIAYIKYNKKGLYGLDYETNIDDNNISSSNYIKYSLDTANIFRSDDKWNKEYQNIKFIYMWIKPTGTITSENEIINIKKDDNNIIKICVNSSSQLILKFNNTTYITTSQSLVIDDWNFIGIELNQQSGFINSIIYLNDNYYDEDIYNQTVNGYHELLLKTGNTLSYQIDILGISNTHYYDNEIEDIYNAGYKYLNLTINEYSYNTKSTFSNNTFDGFNHLRFNELSDNINNYDIEDDYKTIFDNNLNRDVYKIDGKNIYKFEPKLDKTGTISFWFMKPNSSSVKKYILTVQKNNTNLIECYVLNNKVYFKYNNNSYVLLFNLATDAWHHLVINYRLTDMDVALDYTNLRYITFPTGTNDLDNAIYYFGSNGDSLTNTLEGYIENIMYSDDYYSNQYELYNRSRPLTLSLKNDSIGRIKEKRIINNLKTDLTHEYLYNKFRITKEVLETNEELNYTYDNMGNITNITGDINETITYDKLGRIASRTVGTLSESFTYDNNNNIVSKTVGSDTYQYIYNSGNRLTTVKKNNITINTITYDSNDSFKPSTMYINEANKTLTFTGTNLTGINGEISYEYNEFGIRTKKIKGNETTEYELDNDRIIRMKKVSGTNTYIFEFSYDLNNQLFALKYLNQYYYYVRDILGKIIGIIDEDGRYVVKYSYDTFGVPTINGPYNNDVAKHNPFRYMGYYYDEETGFYYLNSRYYNPDIMRFISIDDSSYLDPYSYKDTNLYVYCYNNPVMYSDPDGCFAILTTLIIGAVVGLTAEFVSDLLDGEGLNHSWRDYLGSLVGGIVGGLGIGIGTSVLFGGIGNVVSGLISGNVSSISDAFVQFSIGMISSAISYCIAKGISTSLSSKKISSIIGSSTKNSKINANLLKNKFGSMKVGKMGMESLVKELYKELGYKDIQNIIGYFLDFELGIFL